MKVSILGSTGAMGGNVIKASLQEGFIIENKVSSRDNISSLFKNADVIIDFSCPMATESMLIYANKNNEKKPIVIGTTGLSRTHTDLMADYSKNAPIFYSPNMSFLISITNMIVYSLSKLLDEDFDAEILDIHHKLKKDAPSGTSLMFGKTIAKARNRDFLDIANFVRYGIIEQRRKGEIGFNSQRCGKVVGIHEVSFIGEYENIKIKHESNSKEIYAKGAVKAALWITKQTPDIYTMNNFTKDLIKPLVKSLYKDFFSN